MMMDKAKLGLLTRKLPISRRHLAFLFGVIVLCMFTVLSLLQSSQSASPHSLGSSNEDLLAPINLTENVRVLCWIMTNPSNHETKAIHVKRTWGRRCNKLLLMSSEVDEKVGTIALNVAEGRENLWNKTQEAFRYVYDHHLEEYDWFMKADDDTYVIMENLRYFLYPYSAEFPIYFGSKFRFPAYVNQGYFSGGAGYVLSREAVRRFIEQAVPNSENCHSVSDTEDLELGKCMEYANVTAGDSRDLMGQKRFLPMEPLFHLTSNPAEDPTFWYQSYSFYEPYYGRNCCSDLAISFHYIPGLQMYVMEYLIYELHPYGTKYRNPALMPKKSWEEAIIVPGPYPIDTTTAAATEHSSVPSDVLDMAKSLNLINDTSIEEREEAKMDRLIERLLDNNIFIDKMYDKLEKRKGSK